MFDKPAFAGHESVHHVYDAKTGLRAIIAIHSTVRGPAAGGCRMWNYATSDDALIDALRLSEGMSYKNAMADLPLGGGKAVIWGNSRTVEFNFAAQANHLQKLLDIKLFQRGD